MALTEGVISFQGGGFMRSLSILLCGNGWFAGIPEGETNNAELIVRALDGETLVCGDVRATVRGMTMPVLWRGASMAA